MVRGPQPGPWLGRRRRQQQKWGALRRPAEACLGGIGFGWCMCKGPLRGRPRNGSHWAEGGLAAGSSSAPKPPSGWLR